MTREQAERIVKAFEQFLVTLIWTHDKANTAEEIEKHIAARNSLIETLCERKENEVS